MSDAEMDANLVCKNLRDKFNEMYNHTESLNAAVGTKSFNGILNSLLDVYSSSATKLVTKFHDSNRVNERLTFYESDLINKQVTRKSYLRLIFYVLLLVYVYKLWNTTSLIRGIMNTILVFIMPVIIYYLLTLIVYILVKVVKNNGL